MSTPRKYPARIEEWANLESYSGCLHLSRAVVRSEEIRRLNMRIIELSRERASTLREAEQLQRTVRTKKQEFIMKTNPPHQVQSTHQVGPIHQQVGPIHQQVGPIHQHVGPIHQHVGPIDHQQSQGRSTRIMAYTDSRVTSSMTTRRARQMNTNATQVTIPIVSNLQNLPVTAPVAENDIFEADDDYTADISQDINKENRRPSAATLSETQMHNSMNNNHINNNTRPRVVPRQLNEFTHQNQSTATDPYTNSIVQRVQQVVPRVQQFEPAQPVQQFGPAQPIQQFEAAQPVQQFEAAQPIQQFGPAQPVQQFELANQPVQAAQPITLHSSNHINSSDEHTLVDKSWIESYHLKAMNLIQYASDLMTELQEASQSLLALRKEAEDELQEEEEEEEAIGQSGVDRDYSDSIEAKREKEKKRKRESLTIMTDPRTSSRVKRCKIGTKDYCF
eukprot:g3462.t1